MDGAGLDASLSIVTGERTTWRRGNQVPVVFQPIQTIGTCTFAFRSVFPPPSRFSFACGCFCCPRSTPDPPRRPTPPLPVPKGRKQTESRNMIAHHVALEFSPNCNIHRTNTEQISGLRYVLGDQTELRAAQVAVSRVNEERKEEAGTAEFVGDGQGAGAIGLRDRSFSQLGVPWGIHRYPAEKAKTFVGRDKTCT